MGINSTSTKRINNTSHRNALSFARTATSNISIRADRLTSIGRAARLMSSLLIPPVRYGSICIVLRYCDTRPVPCFSREPYAAALESARLGFDSPGESGICGHQLRSHRVSHLRHGVKEIVTIDNSRYWVIECDGNAGSVTVPQKVFTINLTSTTDINTVAISTSGFTKHAFASTRRESVRLIQA